MDFARLLTSDSPKSHSVAAVFLRSEGAAANVHLPLLLERCQAVSVESSSLAMDHEGLLTYGARSLGATVRAVGFDSDNPTHQRIKDWLLKLSSSRHIQIAGFATYALGDLGIPPLEVQYKLEELIVSAKRDDDLAPITLRGTAFRVLAAIDRALATPFLDSPACYEYIVALHTWLEQRPTDDALVVDLNWLRPE